MKWRGVSETEPDALKSTLREELDERRLNMRRFVPKATQAINDRAVEEFRQQKLAERALKVGAKAPEFTLPDVKGAAVNSRDLLSQEPLIVSFIRGRWCPFCCATVEAWQERLASVKQKGASFVVISPMQPKQADFMRDQHKLMFPILHDQGNRIAAEFGIVYQVPEYQQELFKTVFINLPFINGDDSWTLPFPATFVIGQDELIQYSFADPDYTLRAEPAEVLTFLP
ncbi:MAG TPA: peroxiredoxin-like family protein [Terriglobales bacterium]|nr:peroxiredoxin-like family protein [Terriglobales bacterium]